MSSPKESKESWRWKMKKISCFDLILRDKKPFSSGVSKYGFLKKLLHYECTSCKLIISSHQNMVGYLLHPPNFDDWKWSTDKRCIYNEVISLKNPYFRETRRGTFSSKLEVWSYTCFSTFFHQIKSDFLHFLNFLNSFPEQMKYSIEAINWRGLGNWFEIQLLKCIDPMQLWRKLHKLL